MILSHSLPGRTLPLLLPALLLLLPDAQALELSGRLSGSRTLRGADSPVVIQDSLLVPEGSVLKIEAGVEFRMGPGAVIRVEGEIQALGSKQDPVVFDWLEEGQRWGNLAIWGQKDLPTYDGDFVYVDGSRLDWCVFRHAGDVADVAYNGGAIYLNGAAPTISNCVFENNEAERCGGVLAYNFSLPLISDCTFENNRATLDDGGAVYCFFYSDAVIRHNFIVHNEAGRHGGGIYVSNSSPLIEANALIDNQAGLFGGAMFVSGSESRIIDNALFPSKGSDKTSGIVLQADCRTEVSGNSLLSGDLEITGMNLAYDLDLSGNWWGTINERDVQRKVRQQSSRGKEVDLTLAPWLDRPAENLLTQPVEIRKVQVMASSAWRDTLRFDLVAGATVRVQMLAVDRNKYAIDQAPVEVQLLERPEENFRLILSETEKNSGLFRGEFVLSDSTTSATGSRLNARVGEHVLLRSTMDESKSAHYYVDEPRPVAHDIAIVSDPDPEHIVKHRMQVAWQFFDLLERPQEAWQVQVDAEGTWVDPMEWDSGSVSAAPGLRETSYEGAPLVDGERYHFRIRLRAGGAWSAWQHFLVRSDNAEYSFRLNSIPPTPQLLEPADDVILALYRPTLKVGAVSDREGDTVSYQFQVAETPVFARPVSEQKEGVGMEADWTLPIDLEDNGRYYWRVRVYDGFEFSSWSAPRSFWLNPVEEAPGAFDLIGPEGELADVSPLFRWAASPDPDPRATVHYRFLVGNTADLASARRVDELPGTEFRDSRELPNRREVWWGVEAVDNTGLVTRSTRSMRLLADTTPSTPRPLFPREEEIAAGESFRFEASRDPWPQDELRYELELSGDGDFSQPLIRLQDLVLEDLRAGAIDSWPESRKLKDDQRFFWRLRSVDNHGAASDWSTVSAAWFNRSNDPPSLPGAPYSPTGGGDLAGDVLLSWGESTDADHSDTPADLLYTLQLSTNSDFSGRVVERQAKGVSQIGFGPADLDDNQLWFWRLRCEDDERASEGWTEVQSFVRNTRPDAPAPFAILEPSTGSSSFRLDGVGLNWRPSSDPDWNSSITYQWVLAKNESLGDVVRRGETQAPPLDLAATLQNGETYWLGVTALDDTGLSTSALPVSFRVDSRPTAPVLLSSGPDLELGPGQDLRWQASTDPDPQDAIRYLVRITDPGGRRVVDAAGVESSNPRLDRLYGADGLQDDTFYTVVVTASDSHGLEAESAPGTFWYNDGNDAPHTPAFSNAFASGERLRSTRVEFRWSEMSDPDHSDTPSVLSGQVQLSPSADFDGARLLNGVAGATSAAIDLQDDTEWYARLRILDDEGLGSEWSDVTHFILNTTDDPPSAPTLKVPARNARLVKLDRLPLDFGEASDPDVGGSLSYRVELLSQGGEVLESAVQQAGAASWALDLENQRDYALRVVAVDDTGLETPSDAHSFQVNTTPGPVQIAGREGQVLSGESRLSWTEAIDPDTDDQLVYELQVDRNRAFPGEDLRRVEGLSLELSAMGSRLDRLQENAEAVVRIRAIDNHGVAGPWSPAHSFIWDTRNEAPTFSGSLAPASGTIRSNELRVTWQSPQDPDRREQEHEVVVEISADEGFGEILWTRAFPAKDGGALIPLRENRERWVRAFVRDQDGARSSACPASHYIVNARNEAPQVPDPRSPGSNHEARQVEEFRWSAATDPDPEDRVRYRLEVNGDAGFSESRESTGTSARLRLDQPGTYRWRVVAVDAEGLETAGPERSLRILPPPPPPEPESGSGSNN